MGVWGAGVLDGDAAQDVYQEFMERYDAGEEPVAVAAALRAAYRNFLSSPDRAEGAPIRLALAQALWDVGALAPDEIAAIDALIEAGADFALWRDESEGAEKERHAALKRFAAKIKKPKAKPRPRCKRRDFPPIFEPGACLAYRFSDGDWGAAIVLAQKFDPPKPNGRVFGYDCVATLRYKGGEPPDQSVFERREWLFKTFGAWDGALDLAWMFGNGFAEVRDLIERTGATSLRDDDPPGEGCRIFTGWAALPVAAPRQFAWEAERGVTKPDPAWAVDEHGVVRLKAAIETRQGKRKGFLSWLP